ncbi:MAG: radical SAM protein [Deltaproteobacteria bacterium]|nr:radical SAM protein [Deltaproteobacteria bacterium]
MARSVRRKKTEMLGIRTAIVYPGPLDEGLSSLAVHGLAQILDAHPDASWDLVFAHPKAGAPRGMRSGLGLGQFDLLAFSLSFEEQFTLLPWSLKQAGIPTRWQARGDRHPLILAGGVAMRLNPSPVLPFLDAVVCGDAEQTLDAVIDALTRTYGASRREVLDEMGAVPGVGLRPFAGSLRARFRVPEQPVSQMAGLTGASFVDMHLVETGRGCPVGCRFCALSFSRRPPIFFSPAQIIEAAGPGIAAGKRIGLVGASLGRHPDLLEIVQGLKEVGADLSPASLHPTVLCGDAGQALLDQMQRAKQRTITLAPEAGSERLRQVINKPCLDEELIEAVRRLAEAGCIHLKLYLMFGLPTETDEDLQATVKQVAACREALLAVHRGRGGTGRLSISLNPFVPKPHTPLALAPMPELAELKRRSKMLMSGMRRLGGVWVGGFSPRQARLQAMLDRAGEEAADLLEAAEGRWPPPMPLLRKMWPSAEATLAPDWPGSDSPPWSRVHLGIDPKFLIEERARMERGQLTEACGVEVCDDCRACAGMSRSGNLPPH